MSLGSEFNLQGIYNFNSSVVLIKVFGLLYTQICIFYFKQEILLLKFMFTNT